MNKLLIVISIVSIIAALSIPYSALGQDNMGGAIGQPPRIEIQRDGANPYPIKVWAFFDTDTECLCYVTTANIDCIPASQLSSNVGDRVARSLKEINDRTGTIPKYIILP